MYRIRIHGRGGQGVKTASRVLGSAFFAEGYTVQDAPRYGAERRGAPMYATIRAGRGAIHERGPVDAPDLVVLVDPSLLPLPAAGVSAGGTERSILLMVGDAPPGGEGAPAFPGRVIVLPPKVGGDGDRQGGRHHPLTTLAAMGAAARLSGVISAAALRTALMAELDFLPQEELALNLELALAAHMGMEAEEGLLQESPDTPVELPPPPRWISLGWAPAMRATSCITVPGNALRVPTGLWRTQRPVLDAAACKGCWWICATVCPDGVIHPDGETRADGGSGANREKWAEGRATPQIDYTHCKGCLICATECPSHAWQVVPEHTAPAMQKNASRDTPLESRP